MDGIGGHDHFLLHFVPVFFGQGAPLALSGQQPETGFDAESRKNVSYLRSVDY
jgi:hypothetical protein